MNPLKIAQFWSKVDVQDDLSVCWPWTRGTTKSGYGAFKVDGKSMGAHRVAVRLFGRDVPSGVIVRHKCDNPLCCNPYHLDLGSHNDNVRDRVERSRSAIGAENGRARLTVSQVQAIRQDNRTHTDIAKDYGVDRSTVSHIKKRIIWRHVL